MDVKEEELQELYQWVDSIPLSRPKRNIARDFSDGVLMAEAVHHFYPKLVDLHNYSAANGLAQKLYNWSTLNQRVFKRMGFVIAKEESEAVANCEAGAIERVLKLVKTKMAKFQEQGGRTSRTGSACSSQPVSPAAVQDHNIFEGGGATLVAVPTEGIAALKLGTVGSNTRNAIHIKATGLPSVEQTLKATVVDKEQALQELRETNEILETKIRKLEQLVRLKDAKIQTLLQKLQAAGVN